MATGSESGPDEWISLPAAGKLLGVGRRAVLGLVTSGRISSRKIPSSFMRVLRSDVEAIAREGTVSAWVK